MKVLVIGAGGREHALCWAIAASPMLTKLYCAPGNPGTAELAENIPIPATDIPALVSFAQANAIDLIVPGPEAPLVAGLADACAQAGIRCCGPTAAAARLEGSKAFCKDIADAAGIPTAAWEQFTDADDARAFIRRRGLPLVIKADGLAAGKGVVVAHTAAEAEAAIAAMMDARTLGDAGATILIEECLTGPEISLFALCDDTDAILLGTARDHKRLLDHDQGPNTGGMGAYSPVPDFPPDAAAAALDRIIRPALAELSARGTPFRGILFAGLMLTDAGARLIEFNVRFGDPECQCLLPRLRSDLLPALFAACDGELADFDLRWRDDACVALVLAARGYPGPSVSGAPITGLDAARDAGGWVFHANTTQHDTALKAATGRVLTICALGPDLAAARHTTYAAAAHITWPDAVFRADIASP